MKFLFNPFSRKKEVEKLKELPLPEATKSIATNLKLHGLTMQYNIGFSDRRKFRATITYQENEDSLNPGLTSVEEVIAPSWAELVQKVSDHFEGKESA